MSDASLVNAIRYLSSIYNAPRLRDILPAWRQVLGNVSKEDLEYAVRRYVDTDTSWFPKPGQLKPLLPGRGKGINRKDFAWPEFLDSEDGEPWYMHARYREAIGWRFEDKAESGPIPGSLPYGDIRRRVLGERTEGRNSDEPEESPE